MWYKNKDTKYLLYRIRCGKYRIVYLYLVKDNELQIFVVDVGDRKKVYRPY